MDKCNTQKADVQDTTQILEAQSSACGSMQPPEMQALALPPGEWGTVYAIDHRSGW